MHLVGPIAEIPGSRIEDSGASRNEKHLSYNALKGGYRRGQIGAINSALRYTGFRRGMC